MTLQSASSSFCVLLWSYIKKHQIAPILCSGIFAACVAASFGFYANDGWGTPGIPELFLGLVIWLAGYLVFCIIITLLDWQKIRADGVKSANLESSTATGIYQTRPYRHRKTGISCRRILFRWGIISLCWLPVLLAMFPGALYNDTVFQLGQFFGNPMPNNFAMQAGTVLADHHPVFDTFVFGTLMDIGWRLSGWDSAGLFLLVLLQALATSFSFSFSCNYLEYAGARKLVVRVLFIFYGLFPLFSWLVTLVAKDTFFSWIYIWFLILIYEYIRTKGLVFKRPVIAAAFCLVCILLALTKKPGLYIAVASCLILLLVYRKSLATLVTAIAAPLLVMLVLLPMVIFPALRISPGSPIEMLGIFYQQTARYVVQNPNDVTAAEQQIIDQMFGYSTIAQRYNPFYIDDIKGYGYLEGVEAWPKAEQIQQYLQVYLAQLVRHPDAYLNAIGSLNSRWFYPISLGQTNVFSKSLDFYNNAAFKANPSFRVYRPDFNTKITQKAVQLEQQFALLPIINILYLPSLYVLFVPLLASLLFWKGQRDHLGVMVPVWISFAFLLISPLSGAGSEATRYAIPFIYSAPLLICLAITSYQAKAKQDC